MTSNPAFHRLIDAVLALAEAIEAGDDCSDAWAIFDRNVAAVNALRASKAKA